MTPEPGDLIQSNKLGCNRYRVEKTGRDESGRIWFTGVVLLPEYLEHGGTVESTYSGLTEEGDRLVGRWTYPDQGGYEYLTEGHIAGHPARAVFRVIGRARKVVQLDLFGEAA